MAMPRSLQEQQRLCDEGWRRGLAEGIEQRGNLEASLDFLERTGLIHPARRVLEVGCGIGTVAARLARAGCDVIGTDISGQAIAYGRRRHPGVRLEVQPADRLPYADGAFDLVLSFDVLEHVERVDRHLREVHRVLRPGGHYLFQTPNKYSNVILEMLATGSMRWRRYHPSLHTPGQLRRRLAGHGFEVRFVKVNPVTGYAMAKLRGILRPLRHLARRVDFCRLPLALQTNLYVVARKPPDGRHAVQ